MVRQITLVQDISLVTAQSKIYDLQIFASGYESRTMALPKMLANKSAAKTIVLGFEEFKNDDNRVESDAFYLKYFNCVPSDIPTNSPGKAAQFIDSQLSNRPEECRILVDISSMSRAWYSDIINWARFSASSTRIEIDFCYTAGVHATPASPKIVSEVISLYGFEGRADPRLETVAFIGLGLDPIIPYAVLEDLQPEKMYGYVPASTNEWSISTALEINSAIVEDLDGPVAVIPLLSIEGAYRILCDMIAPHTSYRNVVFVSLGPKTHVLASLLVAAAHEEVTCLHARGPSSNSNAVAPSREIAVCTVVFEKQSPEIALQLQDHIQQSDVNMATLVI